MFDVITPSAGACGAFSISIPTSSFIFFPTYFWRDRNTGASDISTAFSKYDHISMPHTMPVKSLARCKFMKSRI